MFWHYSYWPTNSVEFQGFSHFVSDRGEFGFDSSNTDDPIDFFVYFADCLSFSIFFFIFLGVMSKSAQLGLHGLLPYAIEGPTPLSALLHAATMVTAWIFAFLRLSPLLDTYDRFLNVVVLVCSITAFYSALTASVQNDIKKIIAYSTFSQLWYMVIALGLSQYSLSFFHLINHAFFKSLLFLTACSVIHIMSD